MSKKNENLNEENKSWVEFITKKGLFAAQLHDALEESADALRDFGYFEDHVDKKYVIDGYEFYVRWWNTEGEDYRLGGCFAVKEEHEDEEDTMHVLWPAYDCGEVDLQGIFDIADKVILGEEEEEEEED